MASAAADIGWKAFQAVNKALPESEAITPKWAAEPLLKSYERTASPHRDVCHSLWNAGRRG